MNHSEEQLKQWYASGPNHQVIANGIVIHSGPGWVQAFLDARMNPAYHTIIHLVNGEPGAVAGPRLPSRQAPL